MSVRRPQGCPLMQQLKTPSRTMGRWGMGTVDIALTLTKSRGGVVVSVRFCQQDSGGRPQHITESAHGPRRCLSRSEAQRARPWVICRLQCANGGAAGGEVELLTKRGGVTEVHFTAELVSLSLSSWPSQAQEGGRVNHCMCYVVLCVSPTPLVPLCWRHVQWTSLGSIHIQSIQVSRRPRKNGENGGNWRKMEGKWGEMGGNGGKWGEMGNCYKYIMETV